MNHRVVLDRTPSGIQNALLENPDLRRDPDLSVYGQQKEAAKLNQVCMTVHSLRRIEFSENFGLRGGREIVVECSLTPQNQNSTEVCLSLSSNRMYRLVSRFVFLASVFCLLGVVFLATSPSRQTAFVSCLIVMFISGFYLLLDYLNCRTFINRVIYAIMKAKES